MLKFLIFSSVFVASTNSAWIKIKEIEDSESDFWDSVDQAFIENIAQTFIPINPNLIPTLILKMEIEDRQVLLQKIIQSTPDLPEILAKSMTEEQKTRLMHNSEWMTQTINSMEKEQKKNMIEALTKNSDICNNSHPTKIPIFLILVNFLFLFL